MRQCDINDQPQEVLDAFIDELANDIASLKACSLVSRRWFWRSRKHLFKRVRFSSMRGSKSLRNWSAVMNPSDSPASFTTSLRISQREEAWMSPLTLARYFVHFRLFDRVESLTLSHFSCRTFGQNSLRVLLHNLTLSVRKLCLHHPTACPDSLLGFISIFTNLQETMIRAPRWIFTKYLGAHTTTFHALKGELRLSELDRGSGPFLSLIGSQETRYEKVTLKNCRFREFHPLQQLVSGVAATLRRLDVVAEGDHRREVPEISLSDCVLLEYLAVNVVGPEAPFWRINSMISSITSPHFRKFVLEVNLREFPHIYSRVMQNNLASNIGRLDRPLCTLAKNAARGDQGRFLFILLAYNAVKFVQQLTELNGEGDIVTGEKTVGGNYTCVYIPALAPLRQTVGSETEITYSICNFV